MASTPHIRKQFEARRVLVEDEIDVIEKAIGTTAMQDRLSDEGGLAFCVLTGLLILKSDQVATVLTAAIGKAKPAAPQSS